MSVSIWIQTVWHFDSNPERIFWKSQFWKKSADDKKSMKNYPACNELNIHADLSSETRAITFGLNFLLLPYFVCTSSEHSNKNCTYAWGLSESLLMAYAINIKISCTSSNAGPAQYTLVLSLHYYAINCNDLGMQWYFSSKTMILEIFSFPIKRYGKQCGSLSAGFSESSWSGYTWFSKKDKDKRYFTVSTKFHWNSASSCWEFARKRIIQDGWTDELVCVCFPFWEN